METKQPWYRDCIDKCQKCDNIAHLLCLEGGLFYFVRCSNCSNTSNPSKEDIPALINWNKKQRNLKANSSRF
jgi:hypothetical protein